MEEAYDAFMRALAASTAAVPADYFAVPVAGRDDPISRERAYCYELYHQLRLVLAPCSFPFTLHGEIDKRGHPYYAECVGNRNPDFVIHRPGDEGAHANLVVVEVKPGTASVNRIADDLIALGLFCTCIEYFKGLLLVFGGDQDAVTTKIRSACERAECDTARIDVLWHPSPGQHARSLTVQPG